MKFLSLFVLLTSAAFACPNLEGNFSSCQSSTPGAGTFFKIKKITQERVDGEMIFAVTFADTPVTERTEFFIADNRPHFVETKPILGTKNVRTSTGTCDGEKLELRILRELVTPLGKRVLGEDTAVLSIKSGVITTELQYKSPGRSGETTIICQ